jgi:hypothetical protein
MLIGNDTVRLAVGEDWDDLKAVLGWYDAELVAEARRKVLVPVERGKIVYDGVLEVRLEAAPSDLVLLRARLSAWSHADELNEANLKRLPVAHANALLARIAELEKAEAALELTEPEKNSPGG